MCRWCRLLACLCAAAACADEPTPEAPWFAVDFTQPWDISAGSWSVPSGVDASYTWTSEAARMSFEEYTNAPVAFAPSSASDADFTALEATITLVDLSILHKVPDIPEDGARGALTVVRRPDKTLVYMGLSTNGWVELAGATPVVGVETVYRIAYDTTTSPPRVSYSVDGKELVSATDDSVASFETIGASAAPQVEFHGAGEVSSLTGLQELVERQAAVVRTDGTFDYHADLDTACAAATNGAEVMVLRRGGEMAWSSATNVAQFRLASRLAHSLQPVFTMQGEMPQDAYMLLNMPQGASVACLLFSSVDAAAQSAVHVHGDPAVVYTLWPDADGVHLKSGAVSIDKGGFVGFLSVPEGSHAFVGGLGPNDLGTMQRLYLQGGETTLCGVNTYTGATLVESGTLNLCGVLASTNLQVWQNGEYVGVSPTDGVVTVEGAASIDGPVRPANMVLEDGSSVEFRLSAAESGMILIPSGALPDSGGVSVSVAVEGRYVATTRTALSGDVVATVAGAPEFAARSDAFTLAEDGVTAIIANAVTGFWYSFEASDSPSGPFEPAGDAVRASFDGELSISLSEPIADRRFYRLRVSTTR